MGRMTYGFQAADDAAVRAAIAKGEPARLSSYDTELRRVLGLKFVSFTDGEINKVRKLASSPSEIRKAVDTVLDERRIDRRICKEDLSVAGASSSGGLPAGVGPTLAPSEPLDFGGLVTDLAARSSRGMFDDATQTGISFKLNGTNAGFIDLDVTKVAQTLGTQGYTVPAAVLKAALLAAISARRA